MKKMNKKGFTIVELVIVIAVIAIMSAVLIPTFSGIIKKSRRSADEQAVATINKILATDTEIEDISDAIRLLAENDYELEDYKALAKGEAFYLYVPGNNEACVVVIVAGDTVRYPADYAGASVAAGQGKYFALTGAIEEDDSWVVADNNATISSAAQLASVMNQVSAGKANEVKKVTLSSNVDVMGANLNFGDATANLTVDGGNKTIYAMKSDKNTYNVSGEFATSDYRYGMIPNVTGNVVVENLTIDGMVVEDTASEAAGRAPKIMGCIAGYVAPSGTLTIRNVTVKNCKLSGYQKVAALVGYNEGTVILENVTVENTTVAGTVEAAALIGSVTTNAKVLLEGTGVVKADVKVSYNGTAKTVAAPAVKGVNTDDIYYVSPYTYNGTSYNLTWNAATQRWYWYTRSGNPAFVWAAGGTRDWNGSIWSASEAKDGAIAYEA
ncbi:MAG: prepilin-type N-terminal cleavage/methylation domain-containing protein [Clostridiales bacterium]|nr:prepilin-type N-terminal cleavage/methylation domain-containing protein [Clostridiales bacterium]